MNHAKFLVLAALARILSAFMGSASILAFWILGLLFYPVLMLWCWCKARRNQRKSIRAKSKKHPWMRRETGVTL
ncbi:MAG TPA: hypothetical protein VH308_01955 [Terracidiphilus sp.]|nr:hypothetical protein [Terracidiphilus sp.]